MNTPFEFPQHFLARCGSDSVAKASVRFESSIQPSGPIYAFSSAAAFAGDSRCGTPFTFARRLAQLHDGIPPAADSGRRVCEVSDDCAACELRSEQPVVRHSDHGHEMDGNLGGRYPSLTIGSAVQFDGAPESGLAPKARPGRTNSGSDSRWQKRRPDQAPAEALARISA